MITLQGPDKAYSLKPTLQLIEALESEYGSLYQMAEDLLEHDLPLSEMVDVVRALYKHAGCTVSGDFLLGQPCAEILISFLLGILEPIERAAVPPSSPPAGPFMDEMLKKFPDKKEK